jgi:ATP-binding cassette subfamily B protein
LKHLLYLNKYFWKYRYRLLSGIFFVIVSNYFAVLAPELTGYIISRVQEQLPGAKTSAVHVQHDSIVNAVIQWVNRFPISRLVAITSLLILLLAIMRGVLMFFMRQTLIVMSRHIEYDLKNEIYIHYQQLDMGFFKTHNTGDLMNRITEDVSLVRMYVGPSIMYFTNLVALIGFCVVNMLRKDVHLTLLTLAPLPLLAITIYIVNTIIHKRSEKVQMALSDLTTNAQESYSGIRVIKSFVQEMNMFSFFKQKTEQYRKNALALAKVEAIYFPSMFLMIGLSTLITVLVGGQMALNDTTKVGTIVEFVFYINMLTFPVSSIGWVASMVQRAAASQKRINEFLQTQPAIPITEAPQMPTLQGDLLIQDVSFTYPHTGIKALQHFSLRVKEGEKILILGRTGSGKSTLAQLLLRFYDPHEGSVFIGEKNLKEYPLRNYRAQISYVPQDVFLFSDTIKNNIQFGVESATDEAIVQAAKLACIHEEIMQQPKGYDTFVGERGVTLSGGQKQRISIARALLKQPALLVFDDCLSAVDSKTEATIIHHLDSFLQNKTGIIITHRILQGFSFQRIIMMDDGKIIEEGTHEQLMALNGEYANLYRLQTQQSNTAAS